EPFFGPDGFLADPENGGRFRGFYSPLMGIIWSSIWAYFCKWGRIWALNFRGGNRTVLRAYFRGKPLRYPRRLCCVSGRMLTSHDDRIFFRSRKRKIKR